MKYVALLSAVFASSLASANAAEVQPGAAIPDRPTNNVEMIFAVDAAQECYRTAQTGTDLKFGLEHCNVAMRDPLQVYRAETVVNRGIIRFGLGDTNGALNDFNNALNYNPAMGDAYLNQALVLISEKRPDDAMAAISKGIAMGAANLQIAYYARGMIEDDAGHYAQAYRDYRQAVTIKPGYGPASRELARFKAVPARTISP